LGDNYIHSDKYINNNNFIIPILKFEITLLCSSTPTENHKNIVKNSTIRNNKNNIVNLCLSFNSNNYNTNYL
jgi:hypothetical protein